jgi:CheY-like chemotaxis protein
VSHSAKTLTGTRVLLVEDEALVAMLLEDMLADQGCSVVATGARLDEALTHANNMALEFDVALLDLNLAGESTFSVAAVLAARNIPFAFSTGYGASGLPPEWRDRPTLQKPFTVDDMTKALRQALGRVQSANGLA